MSAPAVGLEPLLKRAFHQAPARDANAEIAGQRNLHGGPGDEATSYEVVLDASTTLAEAAERLLPKLVYFLDCRGAALHDARGVFLSLFVGETLYFVHATDFVAELSSAAGLTLAELKTKYGAASQS